MGKNKPLGQVLSILLTFLVQPVPARPIAVLSRHGLLVLPTIPRETSPLPCDGHRHQGLGWPWSLHASELGRGDGRSDPGHFGSSAPDNPSLLFAKQGPRQRWCARAAGFQILSALYGPSVFPDPK